MSDNNNENNKQEFVYHYNREERQNARHINVNETKRCFICRKNIQMLILLIDVVLVVGVVLLYNFMVGRSKTKSYNGALYFYSKKLFGNFDTQNFVFQIKNVKKNTVAKINSTEVRFIVYDCYGEQMYEENFPITKDSLEYKESFIHTISFSKLPQGRYLTKLSLNNDIAVVFEMYYNSK